MKHTSKSKKKKVKLTQRCKLVNAIIEYSSDEYEDNTDYVSLAKASEDELIDILISITGYYYKEYNA